MSTGAGARKRTNRAALSREKIADLPGTIPIVQVANHLGVNVEAIKDWVGKGLFPEPHSVFGVTWLYRVDLVRVFLETGKWPEGARFKRPATRRDD